MIEGSNRREKLVSFLQTKKSPVSGTELAKHFGVSRQVIVQDIALLRAENRNILSTNKGYILYHPTENDNYVKEAILVKHSAEDILEEMRSVVELGGKILDVSVDHDLYGQIRCDLVINNMEDAKDFVYKMEHATSKPLSVLTGACHYHTIAAPSEKALSLIKEDLARKGILADNP